MTSASNVIPSVLTEETTAVNGRWKSPMDTLRPSSDDYCGSPSCHFHEALVQL